MIPDVLNDYPESKLKFYACGPHGMLMALGQILLNMNMDGELSLDHLMCCGVGACFACVVKIKADNSDGWYYARTCSEGPVFKASQVYYE
jgi:dihydroorotate dehydrogenase electron transfer subunit